MRRTFLASISLLCALLAGVSTAHAQVSNLPDDQLYSFIGKDAPAGVISWQVLRNVKLVEEKKAGKLTMRPEFSSQIRDLDKQTVKVYGFIMPLSTTPKQKHFLISPLPTHCPFCVSQGPDSMIEVMAKTPVDFSSWDPVIVSGKLELLNDSSLFYRLTDAEQVKSP